MPRKTDTTRRPKGSGSEWQDDNGKHHARKEIASNSRTGKRRWVTDQGATKTVARSRLQEKLDRIIGTDIENMCAELGATRPSKTVHSLFVRIRRILVTAVREKLITTNDALAALPPRYGQADTCVLDAGQPGKAIEAAKTPTISKYNPHPDSDDDHDMRALMFDLAFGTGMRQGERFAITPNELETRDGIHEVNCTPVVGL